MNLIDTGTDKRYVKRNKDGTFKESVDMGPFVSADRSKSETVSKPCCGTRATQTDGAAQRRTGESVAR